MVSLLETISLFSVLFFFINLFFFFSPCPNYTTSDKNKTYSDANRDVIQCDRDGYAHTYSNQNPCYPGIFFDHIFSFC